MFAFDTDTGDRPNEDLFIYLWNAGYRPSATTVNHAITAAAVANDYFWLNWFVEHREIYIENCAYAANAASGLFDETDPALASDFKRVAKEVKRALLRMGASKEDVANCIHIQQHNYDAESYYLDMVRSEAATWERLQGRRQ